MLFHKRILFRLGEQLHVYIHVCDINNLNTLQLDDFYVSCNDLFCLVFVVVVVF